MASMRHARIRELGKRGLKALRAAFLSFLCVLISKFSDVSIPGNTSSELGR
jgi:hypothetical protein